MLPEKWGRRLLPVGLSFAAAEASSSREACEQGEVIGHSEDQIARARATCNGRARRRASDRIWPPRCRRGNCDVSGLFDRLAGRGLDG
jgi:hypothetical protein